MQLPVKMFLKSSDLLRRSRADQLVGGRTLVMAFGCCATRPLFAAQKTGTRSVLAESPGGPEKLKRGLIAQEVPIGLTDLAAPVLLAARSKRL